MNDLTKNLIIDQIDKLKQRQDEIKCFLNEYSLECNYYRKGNKSYESIFIDCIEKREELNEIGLSIQFFNDLLENSP